MKLNGNAVKIINELNKAGFDGYVVGGCVRDSMLNKEPKDWDICTNALPEQMLKVFKSYKVIPTGLKHGTITVMLGEEGFEVTTYRIDGDYSDGRHPDEVIFTNKIEEDLSRRDFTINSTAYSEKDGLIDIFGGKSDLEQGIIRCVGSPCERFGEDSLRILRALRFASVLDFEIENETAEVIHTFKDKLKNVSAERISVEISKILTGKGVSRILREFKDVIFEIIPELEKSDGFEQNNPYHKNDVWTHTIEVVRESENDRILKIAALLHDVGKPYCYTEKPVENIGHFYGHAEVSRGLAEEILNRLRFSNKEIEEIITLIKYHDIQLSVTTKFIKRMINKLGESTFRKLLKLNRADVKGQQGVIGPEERLNMLDEIEKMIDNLELDDLSFTLKSLAISGDDLIKKGYKPSKEIGETLNRLLEMVINEEIDNTKEELLKHC